MKSYKNKALNPQEMRRSKRRRRNTASKKQKREEQVGVIKYFNAAIANF